MIFEKNDLFFKNLIVCDVYLRLKKSIFNHHY